MKFEQASIIGTFNVTAMSPNGKHFAPCLTCPLDHKPVFCDVKPGSGPVATLPGPGWYLSVMVGQTETKPGVDLFVVGEAPGSNEVVAKRPFIGSSGKLLRTVLENTDASWVIGNTVLCKPMNDEGKIRAPTAEEAANCSVLIKTEVLHCKPRSLLLLGRTAFRAFLPSISDATSMCAHRGHSP